MKSLNDLKEQAKLEFRRLDDFDRMLIDNFLEQAYTIGSYDSLKEAIKKHY